MYHCGCNPFHFCTKTVCTSVSDLGWSHKEQICIQSFFKHKSLTDHSTHHRYWVGACSILCALCQKKAKMKTKCIRMSSACRKIALVQHSQHFFTYCANENMYCIWSLEFLIRANVKRTVDSASTAQHSSSDVISNRTAEVSVTSLLQALHFSLLHLIC